MLLRPSLLCRRAAATRPAEDRYPHAGRELLSVGHPPPAAAQNSSQTSAPAPKAATPAPHEPSKPSPLRQCPEPAPPRPSKPPATPRASSADERSTLRPAPSRPSPPRPSPARP